MDGRVYLLMVGPNVVKPDIIYSRDSELKIAVYNVCQHHYIPHTDEIQLYGYLNDNLLVFETIDIEPEDALEMLTAIKWYTNYIGVPHMEILPDDPRMPHETAIAL